MAENSFKDNRKYAVGIKLANDWVELVFKPFEVFLGGDMWEELVKHVFKWDGKIMKQFVAGFLIAKVILPVKKSVHGILSLAGSRMELYCHSNAL